MPVEAVLIGQPAIDLPTLLGLTHQALGYNIASAADSSHRKMSDVEKFLACLAKVRDEHAPADLTPNLFSFANYIVLVVADHDDLLDILQAAAGMPFVRAETLIRNVDLAFISGSLAQWRDAVATGASEKSMPSVRACFSKILLLFDREGLSGVWSDYSKRAAPDRSGFYLEHK